jgi:cobalt-zinc-cadmium resistance protein CzcA
MTVRYKRNKVAYYGKSIEDLNNYLTMAFGGAAAGVVFEGEKRFDLVVRLQAEYRTSIEHIRNLPVALGNGKQVPLSELAEVSYATGPAKISRDDTRRRVVVSVNVRNRDLESVVNDIEFILDNNLDLPAGYFIDYGGQFENLRNASRRLKLAVPVALLLIFIFLHFTFSSFKEAALIFTAVPLSVVGGVFLLWIRGMPFSISAGIGFIALFGVAVLNGIVLIEHLKDLKKQGISDMRERILKGTRERLRPVLLTAGAAALGFLPMAISTSSGAEVQRPLATVVIGGLVTSTLLTMLALPLLYAVVDDITGIQIWPPKFIKKKLASILLLFFIPALAYTQTSTETPEEPRILNLSEVLDIAYTNNAELEAFRLKAEEQKALIRTAYSFDKTSLYYNYDENNIAANDYPIGVFGGEQRFDFPTVYFAKKEAYGYAHQMALNEYQARKRQLTRDVSKTYYYLLYLAKRLETYAKLDSLYSRLASSASQSYDLGAISYLELLNSQSVLQEVILLEHQMKHDVQIAYKNLSTFMQYDSLFVLPDDSLKMLTIIYDSAAMDPGLTYLQNANLKQAAELKAEKQGLLPDLTLSYFNGSNNYEGGRHYQGFEVGLGIPIFFSEQRAKVKAKQHALEATSLFQSYYLSRFENRMNELETGLHKYRAALDYYEETGRKLAAELIRSSELSFSTGEIDFFQFTQSVERAVNIVMNYLDNLHQYNELVLDINYLTLEN